MAANVISPLPSAVHVNRPMTNMSLAYMQAQSNFVASQVFPTIAVNKQSDFYFSFPKGTFYKNKMKTRGLSEESPLIAFGVQSETPYNCVVKSVAEPVDDRLRANVDDPIQIDRIVSLQLTMSDLIERESRWIAAFFGASIWTGDYTGVSASPTTSQFLQWDNSASDPIVDVVNAKARAFLAMGGVEPNVMVMGKPVFDILLQHPDIIDRIKYGQTPGSPAMVTKEMLAALFGVDRIVVASAIQDTSVDGPATTTTLAYIAGKHVGLFYVPPSPGLMQMAPGYTFAWNGYLGLGSGSYNAMGSRIRNWRQESIRSDVFEIESAIDMKLVCADAGTMLLSAVA